MAFSRKLELETIKKMILLYCQHEHSGSPNELCQECSKLYTYAEHRVDKCVYGDSKPVCSECPVHCYKPALREEVKKVMRYAGPRMMRHSPILALRYMYRKRYKSPL